MNSRNRLRMYSIAAIIVTAITATEPSVSSSSRAPPTSPTKSQPTLLTITKHPYINPSSPLWYTQPPIQPINLANLKPSDSSQN
ncbi:hypothetical protein KC19_12G140900 [Ceratodon purpureus]|uniref:Uncharacterized protein n=1 Tax=Ceratodon purpureus TaxID=3225 RepID=A0A8T0G9B2_CERPU|nr:hypothetical protein KC19_12G140900 [Ceratodon purpureus]